MMTESRLIGTKRVGSGRGNPKSQEEFRWLRRKNYETLVVWRRDFCLRHPEASWYPQAPLLKGKVRS